MSNKIFFKSISFSYLRQILALVLGIVSVPLMLNYFGTNLFGIWALILGLAGYINNISFGIPSAMSILVAKTSNLRDKYKILTKSFFLLSAIVIIFLLMFMSSILISDMWIITLLGNIDVAYVNLTKEVFILFVIITLIRIPFNIYIQFFTGMNLVYISEIYQIINLLAGFLSLVLSIYLGYNLYVFTILTLSSQIIISMASMFHVIVKFKYLSFKKSTDIGITNKIIIKSSLAFFQVGLAASIVWNTDNLVINHFLSAEYVTSYTIAFKMFTYIFIFSAIINGVISPIYGNAYAKKDFITIRLYASTILKVLPVVGGIVWFSLLFFAKDIINVWTGNEEAFGGYLLIFSLGFYGFVLSYVNTYATIIFSLNFANKALWIVWSEALLNLLLSVIFIDFFGIGGVALATAFASLLTGFIFLPKIIKKLTDNRITFEYRFLKKHFIFLVIPAILVAIFSIEIESFLIKLFLYIFILFIYIISTYKLLTLEDKSIILQVLQRKA